MLGEPDDRRFHDMTDREFEAALKAIANNSSDKDEIHRRLGAIGYPFDVDIDVMPGYTRGNAGGDLMILTARGPEGGTLSVTA